MISEPYLNLEQWRTFRNDFSNSTEHSANLYRLKMRSRMHWGPFAMLVRESAFRSYEMGNHDYLGAPEVVEDICQACHEHTGIDLLSVFMEQTYFYIIKFWDDRDRNGLLKPALCYLHAHVNKYEMNMNNNICFDSKATVVAAKRILKIDTVSVSSYREVRPVRENKNATI